MQIQIFTHCVFFLALLTCSSAARMPNATQDRIRSSCLHASFPDICIRTLSNYAGPVKTPKDLALATVRISLAQARSAYTFLHKLAPLPWGGPSRTPGEWQQYALSVCVELISHSLDQLNESLNELQHLRAETFESQKFDVQALMTGAGSFSVNCRDELVHVNGKLKDDLNHKITDVIEVIGNALYMISLLASN